MMDLSQGKRESERGGHRRGGGRGRDRGGVQPRFVKGGHGRERDVFYPIHNTNPNMQNFGGHSPYDNSIHPRDSTHELRGYGSPPPSYDESMQYGPSAPPLLPMPLFHRPSPNNNYGEKDRNPHPRSGSQESVPELVKTLALFKGQWATSDTLTKQLRWDEQELMRVVLSRKDLFAHMKHRNDLTVELVPNLKLCTSHGSEDGCMNRKSCSHLHFCQKFITGYCGSNPCNYGHKFDTDHNTKILSKLYLDLLDRNVLVDIIKKIVKGNDPPKICGYYNTNEGCRKKNESCKFFHICKAHIQSGGNCPNNNCPYNHRIDTKQCRSLLLHHGMSVNETPRDIIINLRSSLQNLENPLPQDGTHRGDSSSKEKTENFMQNKASQEMKPPRSATVKSTDLYGDTEIPEICIYSVNNKCTNEKRGCKYLHAKSLFHWQFEKENTWYNLRIFQSKCLESAYRDVTMEGVKIPPLDVEKIEPHNKKILDLLGTKPWTADFQKMYMKNPSGLKLKIRRIATASAAVSPLPQATVYEWYFGDENDKWILYGEVDSLGKQQYICNITSADIEKQYMKDPSQPMTINSVHYKYQLDFKQMTQTNLSTGKVRAVRRRPGRLSYQKMGMDKNDDKLPRHWRPMKADQTHVLIPLDTDSQEYQDVVGRVRLTLPRAYIHTVKRLQNQYLWRLMQYKKADLLRRYLNFF